ncbi:unnamed protein product [Knipowitschia caucasica]|uniref:L1 transposable element RRM domain-containing protein n=1 Tax=Knipowitschia caucasica TaxID=637954 RepID=A0AAV2JJ90_KNICA
MSGKNAIRKSRTTIQTQLPPSMQANTDATDVQLASSEPGSTLFESGSGHVADTAVLKLEILSSLKEDIAGIIKKELQDALVPALTPVRSDLQALQAQLAANKAATDAILTTLKGTVEDMETALSECTDDITNLKTTVAHLTATVTRLEGKCENLEARSRRQNIRIVGVHEGPNTCTTTAVAALLKETLGLDNEPRQSAPGERTRPRAIVCRLHYYSDCVDILRRARERGQIKVRDMTISVFPDYTDGVARARAAFNDVRRQLRNIEGVRYGLFYPARLRITYRGAEKEFTSADDAGQYVKTMTTG